MINYQDKSQEEFKAEGGRLPVLRSPPSIASYCGGQVAMLQRVERLKEGGKTGGQAGNEESLRSIAVFLNGKREEIGIYIDFVIQI